MEEETELSLREAQEELSKLKDLKTHPGFVYLLAIAEAQMETRKQSVFLRPLKDVNEVLEQEYSKGEISGIALFYHIADTRIQELSEAIEEKLKEIEEHERTSDGRNTDSSTDSGSNAGN